MKIKHSYIVLHISLYLSYWLLFNFLIFFLTTEDYILQRERPHHHFIKFCCLTLNRAILQLRILTSISYFKHTFKLHDS